MSLDLVGLGLGQLGTLRGEESKADEKRNDYEEENS